MAPRDNGDKMRGVSAGRSDLVDAHSWLTKQRQRAKYGGILLTSAPVRRNLETP